MSGNPNINKYSILLNKNKKCTELSSLRTSCTKRSIGHLVKQCINNEI